MNAHSKLTAERAVSPPKRQYDYSRLNDLAHAARRLHEAAVRASAVPGYPENAQVIAGLEEFVITAIKNMKEALNG